MKASPEHGELHDLLPAAALGILDQEDRQRVLAHVRQCADCARSLEEFREVAGRLGLLLPPQPLDPARSAVLRARLVARARREWSTNAPPTRHAALLAERWTGWMVAAALAGVTLIHHGLHRPLDYGWVAAGTLAVLLVAVSWYAVVQRRRLALLRHRLLSHEREDIVPPEPLGREAAE